MGTTNSGVQRLVLLSIAFASCLIFCLPLAIGGEPSADNTAVVEAPGATHPSPGAALSAVKKPENATLIASAGTAAASPTASPGVSTRAASVSGALTTPVATLSGKSADGARAQEHLSPSSAGWSVGSRSKDAATPEDTDSSSVSLSLEPGTSAGQTTAASILVNGCPITAVPNTGGTSTFERAPNLRNRFGRTHYLILASELAAAGITPGTQFAGIGWSFQVAPGLSGTNNLIVYMENTADTTNVKSATWSTAISTMTVAHNGSVTIPNVTGPWDILFSGAPAFTYTGGGLYIAFDAQYPVGTLSTTTAVWCNSTGLVGGLKGAEGAAPPTTLTTSSFRPETRLTPTTATIFNDASVDVVVAYGAIPKNLVGPQVVQAVVSNRGANPITNLSVTLNVTGANAFTDTKIVPSLAPCSGQAVVTFAAYSPANLGTDTLTVTVPPDDVASNNSRSRPTDITIPRYSFKHPGTTATGGVGLAGVTGALVGKFTTTSATAITAVELAFSAVTTTTYRIAVYADSGGTPGANLYTDASDRTVGAAGPITIPIGPVAVGPGNFYVGIQQTNTTNASLSYDAESPIRAGKFYLAAPLPVTSWSDFSPLNPFKLNVGVVLDPCAGGGNCFPPSGSDNSPTTGIFHVDLSGIGPVETSVSGMTHLQWSNPYTDAGSGLRTVDTELLSLSLSGSSPNLGTLEVRGGSSQGLPPSLGKVVQSQQGADFPADAFFDVFFEVEVNGSVTLHNSEPLRMEAEITEIPPRNIGLRNASPVLITNNLDPSQVSVLRTAGHWMCPPPFPPPGTPCPVPCNRAPYPTCRPGDCPGHCSGSPAIVCRANSDCPVPQTCVGIQQCVPLLSIPNCVCANPFPVAGTDLSPTTGIFRVDVTGVGPVDASVSGDTLLQWQDPVTGPTGQRTVQTEMLAMSLNGADPGIGSIHITAGSNNGLPATLGQVTPNDPNGGDFPAHAFFDVFFEIQVNGTTTLRNSQPLVMEADITEIPPRSIGLRNRSPVQIATTAAPGQISVIQRSQHWMCPPPFPPPGTPCPVPCDQTPYPVCRPGTCPTPSQQCVPLGPFFPQDGYEGRCVCVDVFPPAGSDNSPTVGTFHVDLQSIGPVETTVSGNTLLQWQNPVVGPGGQRTVQTELVSLSLTGSDPTLGSLTVHAGTAQGLPPSTGSVVPVAAGSDFPALATFDVFFEVVVNGTTTLRNDQPLVMRAPITEIPPRSIGLQNATPVALRDLANPSQVNTIQTAQHWMCPPPFPPPGTPCPVPCERNPYPVCRLGTCPVDATGVLLKCVPNRTLRACRCARPSFPPHGVDLSPTSGVFRVAIGGLGVADAQVSGQVLLRWQDPVTGPGGQRTVQTEMLSLDLTGTSPTLGPLHVRGGSSLGLPATLGQVTPVGPGSDFPANAFFDVFFEVQAAGTTLVNDQPLHMQAEIDEIPPRSIALQNASPVPLRNTGNPGQTNQIQTAAHWMCPPPYPPQGVPCPIACNALQQPLCSFGVCPPGLICTTNAVGCGCVAPPPAVSGVVPANAPLVPLKITKAAGGQITLTWGASCLSSDNDYGIYEGTLGTFYSHTAIFCTTGGALTKTLTPATGRRYYLVVPHGSSVEGSYGTRSSGAERPQGTTPCLPRSIGPCP